METKQVKKVFSAVTFLTIIFLSTECVLASPESSSPQEVLSQKAQSYMKEKDYSKAEETYKTIMTKWPKSHYALEAQKNLVILDISTGSLETPLAFGKFLADHVYYHPENWAAIGEILAYYQKSENLDTIIKSHQNLLSKYSKESNVVWAQSGLAICYLRMGEMERAASVVEKLLSDYSNHPDIAGGIALIATFYRVRNTDRAIELYQYILSKHPSDSYVVQAQYGLAASYVWRRSDTEAESAIEKLLSDYANHPDIAGGIRLIAGYYRSRNTPKAIELYQYILTKYPSGFDAMHAQSGLAACYIIQGEMEKAELAVKKLLSDYSNHSDIARGIGLVASCYRSKKIERAIELYQHILNQCPLDFYTLQDQSSLAASYILQKDVAKAESATEKLKKNYSDHPWISDELGKIADYYKIYRMSDNAINLYEYVLRKYPSSDRVMKNLAGLAICYQESDKPDEAKAALEKLKKDFADHSRIVFELNTIAHYYQLCAARTKVEPDDAIELYQYVLSKYPLDDQVINARHGITRCYSYLAKSYISQKDLAKAEKVVEELKKNYSGHLWISDELIKVADSYRIYRMPDDAINLYEYVLKKYPSSDRAINTQAGLAICYQESDKPDEAKVTLETLKKDFADHPRIVFELNTIAHYYRMYAARTKVEPFDAIELYEYVLSQYPLDEQAINAQYGIAMCHVLSNKNVAVIQPDVKKLLVDFIDHPDVLKKMDQIIPTCEKKGQKGVVDGIYPEVYNYFIDNKKPLQAQKTLLLIGIKYCNEKTTYAVLEKFMSALSKSEDSIDVVNELTDSCHELKKYEMAEIICQNYLNGCTSESNKKEIELKRYESICLSGTQLEKLIPQIDTYIDELKETDKESLITNAMLLKGRVLVKLGEVDKASEEFLSLVTKYPKAKESSEAHFFVGYFYMFQGKYDQAKKAFGAVVEDDLPSTYAGKVGLYLKQIEGMTQ